MNTLNFDSSCMEKFLHHRRNLTCLDQGVDISKLINKKDEPLSTEQYDEKDVKELEEFCKKYGILGFNLGNINPKNALRTLKNKMGIVEDKPIIKEEKKLLLD